MARQTQTNSHKLIRKFNSENNQANGMVVYALGHDDDKMRASQGKPSSEALLDQLRESQTEEKEEEADQVSARGYSPMDTRRHLRKRRGQCIGAGSNPLRFVARCGGHGAALLSR